MRNAGCLLAALAALLATATTIHAGTLSGQLVASCTFTPYSGTNGTGTIVNDLTLAKSVVLNPATIGTETGSFTAIPTQQTLNIFTPITVNPAVTPNAQLWSSANFSFKSGPLSTAYVANSLIYLTSYGSLSDGVSGDQSVAYFSMSLSLASGNPANSSCIISTTSITNPVPTLAIRKNGANAVISWPTNSTGFTLQSTPLLKPPVTWSNVTNAVTVSGTNFSVGDTSGGSQKYYRLAY